MWRVGWWYNWRRVEGVRAGGAKWFGREADCGAATFIILAFLGGPGLLVKTAVLMGERVQHEMENPFYSDD